MNKRTVAPDPYTRRGPSPSALFAALAAALLVARTADSLDTIVIKNGDTFTGTFDSFKNDRFYFTPTDGGQLHQLRAQVVSLKMDPAVAVSLKLRGKSKDAGTNFARYEDGQFVFVKDGKESSVLGSQVTTVEIGMDFKRAMAHQQQLNQQPPQAETDIEAEIRKGVVNIIHFHAAGEEFDAASRAASTRTANYIGSLQNKTKGKVNVITIALVGWKDPAAVKYGITSAPQFWFYKRSGELSTKLVERFTSADIDAAVHAAQK